MIEFIKSILAWLFYRKEKSYPDWIELIKRSVIGYMNGKGPRKF